MRYLMENYARLPIRFTRGEGCYLYDEQGRKYLDALAGIAVCGLGHAQPELAQTVTHQAQTLWHVSNLFQIPEQEEAAERLCAFTGMEKVYFCNSGAEANEAALKISRLHARTRNIENPIVLTFEGSFHGRTFGAMSATGNAKIHDGFAPLLAGFEHLPYNDIEAVRAFLENPNVVAVLLETVQGESGVNLADQEFLHALRQFCTAKNWLLMIDEVQTGIARTGSFVSYLQHGIYPDVTTLAKGLGNGVPVAATLARGAAANYFQPGKHGSTFGGTPFICAIVNKVLQIYQRDNLAAAAEAHGQYFLTQLEKALAKNPKVKTIRGRGLMIGIELVEPIDGLMLKALEKGVIINVTAGKVIRLLPPLIINQEEIVQVVTVIQEILS